MVCSPRVEVRISALEGPQDVPRPVSRDVVDRVDAVAEVGDVPDRVLDEEVLVANEDNADDLRRFGR